LPNSGSHVHTTFLKAFTVDTVAIPQPASSLFITTRGTDIIRSMGFRRHCLGGQLRSQ